MALKHVIKLSTISGFINDNKIIKRGENALESGHVKKMEYDRDFKIIRGEVLASMKNKSYKVSIELDNNGDISSATCACPRGIKCHHIVALALFGRYNISVTDKACSWNAPPKPKVGPLPQSAEELNPNEGKAKLLWAYCWIHLVCEKRGNIFSNKYFPAIQDIISSDYFLEATDKISTLKERCAIDDQLIKDIAASTTGQVSNENWYIARKFRLTSSNFGAVISAGLKNKFPSSLFKTLLGEYNLDGIKAIQWGRTHEKDAVDCLKQDYQLNIRPTGIWLSRSGLLGASPDGLIDEEEATLEIKCPYSFRNDQLSEKLRNNNKYIIFYDDVGNLRVNKNHHYYHQIQGALHILNRKKCYLCIFTLKDNIVTVIEYDESWKENLQLLENFYFQHYFPMLLDN
ncbi:uncharacterized protein LOC126891323 [Diabrotica virgifera virgifera]|uniref:SWIM-type domain-containing protein n=1 Tax=Diabrotica virgifera virgifera TaxID=50390 RepID=A0ABM5L1Z4_DIAVI|nr:uncharacterized protein LOC126891323 [Diabrotica virgifera virgifera]